MFNKHKRGDSNYSKINPIISSPVLQLARVINFDGVFKSCNILK